MSKSNAGAGGVGQASLAFAVLIFPCICGLWGGKRPFFTGSLKREFQKRREF